VKTALIPWLKKWNRRIHYHLGLFTLLFVWIFSLSGLFLNHPDWFSERAKWTETFRDVQLPKTGDDQVTANEILRQLNLSGEKIYGFSYPEEEHLRFRVIRFNGLTGIDADLLTGRVRVRSTHWSLAKSLSNLHTLTGVRKVWNESNSARDWIMTWIWSVSIDAIAVALIVMTLSSIYMWLQLKPKRKMGLLALGLGTAVCVFFLWGYSLLPKG